MINYKLKDLIKIHNGTKYSHLESGVVPLYGSGGIMSFVNDFLYDGEAVLLPRKGTLSNIMYTKGKIWTVDTMYYATTNEKVKPYYLYCYLSILDLQHLDSGSALPSMTKSAYENLEINLPNIQTQKSIAKVLSDLDAKIELNNKINKELEAMAKTLYDYWFVQFDFPFDFAQGKPSNKGKPYKTSGGKMVYNEVLKREIPEGWVVGTLSDFVKIERGISYKSIEIDNTGKPMINLNSFYLDGSYKVGGLKYFIGNYNEKKIAQNGDLLIAVTDVTRNADIIGKSILLPNIFKETVLFSMDVAKITPTKELGTHFLNMLFNSQPYHDFIKQFASGTLVLHLDLRAFNFYKFAIPEKSIIDDYSKLKINIEKRKSVIIKENQQLTQLRDWLLPMLMNGQVRVGELDNKMVYGEDEGILSQAAESGVEYDAKVIPISKEVEEQHFLKRKVLASYIINQSLNDNFFGDVKFEKLLHLSEYYVIKRNFKQNYKKQPAGPYDNSFTYPFFQQVIKSKWFYKESKGKLNRIKAGSNHSKSLKTYGYYTDEELARVDGLIRLFANMNYEVPEIVSTLYAVWNNRIINNELITDALLKQDFLNWDKNKEKYKDRLDNALDWMRKNDITPDGWGKIIEKKKTKK